jgi:ATP-dependent DNA helicase RecG
MRIMPHTGNGFEIAEKDLMLRGPGEIEGTRQSGALAFKLASLVADRSLLEVAREKAAQLLEADPGLEQASHASLKEFMKIRKGTLSWSKIS